MARIVGYYKDGKGRTRPRTSKVGSNYTNARPSMKRRTPKDYDKIDLMTINGTQYDVRAFHPRLYETGVYSVNFHEHGKPYLDRYSDIKMVEAKDRQNAINKAQQRLVFP